MRYKLHIVCIVLAIVAFALGVVLGVGAARLPRHGAEASTAASQETSLPGAVEPPPNATITTYQVEERPWVAKLTIPGRTAYDETKHVQVLATSDGILEQVLVHPGERVTRGQLLAILSSSEVAAARAEVQLRDEERQLAERQWQWEEMICQNVEALIEAIQNGEDLATLEKQFAGRVIGEAREKLLGGYARLRAAETLVAIAQPLQQERTLPLPTIVQRDVERQTASAALMGVCERMQFESRKARDQAALALRDAERRLEISRQKLAALLGYDESPASRPQEPAAWSRFELRAPAAGTLEQRYKASAERVRAGEVLLLIADTSQLWLKAEIREQDWLAVQAEPGQDVEVHFPGAAPRTLAGKIVFVGREVSLQSNSIPLIVAVNNTDGTLRPGMFARVFLPVGAPRQVLQVPAASVLRHEGERFVFVANPDGTYSPRAIQIGAEEGAWIPVEKGLKAGEKVVVEGAFLLKSALLLESFSE